MSEGYIKVLTLLLLTYLYRGTGGSSCFAVAFWLARCGISATTTKTR